MFGKQFLYYLLIFTVKLQVVNLRLYTFKVLSISRRFKKK